MDQHPIHWAFWKLLLTAYHILSTFAKSQEIKKGNRHHHKTQVPMDDSKLNWFLREGIDKRLDLILKIIGIYDMLENYYCNGNIESVKKYMKYIEDKIYGYFKLKELGK